MTAEETRFFATGAPDRFDVTLVLARSATGWSIEQVPQMLLPGDTSADVSVADPNAPTNDDEDD